MRKVVSIGFLRSDLAGALGISFAFEKFLNEPDLYLNHITNQRGSLLTAVHGYNLPVEQKIQIFKDLITHLKTLSPDLPCNFQLRVNYFNMIFPGEDSLQGFFNQAVSSNVSAVKIVDILSEPYQKLARSIESLIETLPK